MVLGSSKSGSARWWYSARPDQDRHGSGLSYANGSRLVQIRIGTGVTSHFSEDSAGHAPITEKPPNSTGMPPKPAGSDMWLRQQASRRAAGCSASGRHCRDRCHSRSAALKFPKDEAAALGAQEGHPEEVKPLTAAVGTGNLHPEGTSTPLRGIRVLLSRSKAPWRNPSTSPIAGERKKAAATRDSGGEMVRSMSATSNDHRPEQAQQHDHPHEQGRRRQGVAHVSPEPEREIGRGMSLAHF